MASPLKVMMERAKFRPGVVRKNVGLLRVESGGGGKFWDFGPFILRYFDHHAYESW